MLGKTKEIGSRYASSTDFTRVVHKAFELLNSSSPDSDQELLELVKKAKREGDKDPLPNPKKVRTGRIAGELSDVPAVTHRSSTNSVSSEHAASGSDTTAGSTGPQGGQGSTSIGQAQARLMNVIRAGSGRGRGDKAKRKGNR